MLPTILVQMETGYASAIGALDMCGLVMVSVGVCSACALCPHSSSGGGSSSSADAERKASLRGLYINAFFGDYIEACYPLLERDWAVNVAAHIGSAIAGAILASGEGGWVTGTAYVPIFFCPLLSNSPLVMAQAIFAAGVIPFMVCLARNKLSHWKTRNDEEDDEEDEDDDDDDEDEEMEAKEYNSKLD
jgi:hypothetical protein